MVLRLTQFMMKMVKNIVAGFHEIFPPPGAGNSSNGSRALA